MPTLAVLAVVRAVRSGAALMAAEPAAMAVRDMAGAAATPDRGPAEGAAMAVRVTTVVVQGAALDLAAAEPAVDPPEDADPTVRVVRHGSAPVDPTVEVDVPQARVGMALPGPGGTRAVQVGMTVQARGVRIATARVSAILAGLTTLTGLGASTGAVRLLEEPDA